MRDRGSQSYSAEAHLLTFHVPTRMEAAISEIHISDVGNAPLFKVMYED
jgi:hypothetical protein